MLRTRSQSKCELCQSSSDLKVYESLPASDWERELLVCGECLDQMSGVKSLNPHHWRILGETMWSEFDAVKVEAWRMLTRLSSEGWAQDLLAQLYLEDDLLELARSTMVEASNEKGAITKDSNGTQLLDGDSVTLIKDLDVKGASFTAKRGTMVKNISLTSNPLHIEGRVNGVQIVLVAAYLKKVN